MPLLRRSSADRGPPPALLVPSSGTPCRESHHSRFRFPSSFVIRASSFRGSSLMPQRLDLVGRQPADRPGGKRAEPHGPDGDPRQPQHLVADAGQKPAYLAVLPLAKTISKVVLSLWCDLISIRSARAKPSAR